jgi:hypothetical protein
VPPAKQGDYAYLLHIIRSLKSTGKGACILPHGVLFRGNAEAVIRSSSSARGIPQGHHRPAGQPVLRHRHPRLHLVLDKENAAARKGIFMIDASKGFIKDGPRTACASRTSTRSSTPSPGRPTSRATPAWCPRAEIADPKNDFNLNLPRYIDSTEPEDLQDIDGHLRGGIPERDLDALGAYWQVSPACARRCSSPQDGLPPRLRALKRRSGRGQARHLRPCRVHRLHDQRTQLLRQLAQGRARRAAHGLRQGRPPQGADRDHRRGPAGHV